MKRPLYFLQFAGVAAMLSLLVSGQLAVLQNSYLFISYTIIMVLTLPMVIAKTFLQRCSVGLVSVAFYLLYFGLYLAVTVITNLMGIDFATAIQLSALLLHILWQLGIFILIRRLQEPKDLKPLLLTVLGWLPYALLLLLALRSVGSVLAFDYFQHQTVVNGMMQGGKVCLVPIDCSNQFLQQGYLTVYHAILGFMTSFAGNDLVKTFFLLDFIFPLAAATALFKFFIKHANLAALAVALSLLTFVNGAYELAFFIPQTLSFWLFMQILALKDLSWRQTAAGVILLLLTHLVMGAFLSAILIIRQIIFATRLNAWVNRHPRKFYTLLGIPLITATIFNFSGYSIEKTLQQGALAIVGMETNFYFPENLIQLASILGWAMLLVLLAVGYAVYRQKAEMSWLFPITFIAIGLTWYFLAPTYASKFLIGMDTMAALLVVKLLQELKLRGNHLLVIAVLLLTTYAMNFTREYQEYAKIFKQDNGTFSAVVPEDQALIGHLQTQPNNCVILSDPYSQAMVDTFTPFVTARGRYLQLEGRKKLFQFVVAPNTQNWRELIQITDLGGNDRICFLYSSRLAESQTNNKTSWLNYIYFLPLENNFGLGNTTTLQKIMRQLGYYVTYQDANYLLFEQGL